MPVLMPKDTREVLGLGAQKCESRSLLQQKLVFFDDTKDIREYKQISLGFILSGGELTLGKLCKEKQQEKRKAEESNRTDKAKYRQACAFLAQVPGIIAGRRPLALNAVSFAWLNNVPAARKRSFEMQTADRLIIGQADGVLENCGLTLHRYFGIPCLPGSALKGLARDAAIALSDVNPRMKELFGNDVDDRSAMRGGVGFLPAFPADAKARIECDICTPHYKGYYGHEDNGRKNPKALDTENPVPNVFPVVAKGVVFRFNLLALGKRLSNEQASGMLDMAEKALRQALVERGVGAKTAAGYGRFEEVNRDGHGNEKPSQSTKLTPGIPAENPVILNWRGRVTTSSFKAILRDLTAISDRNDLEKVFLAIMPESELKPNKFKKRNPFWQSFSARPEGQAILSRLNLKLE